jgi:hypothetical protein
MYSLYNGVSPSELEPSECSIGQNYPNPFKEKTIIKYCVAYKSRVQIVVYDSKGKLIEKLVDEEKKPGTYEVEFNALTDHSGKSKNLLDGYYFYQMIAGDYSSEKKWLCINNLLRSNKMKTFLQTLFFFLLTTQICFGQWVQVGLNDEVIKDIAVQNQNIFAVTSDSCGSWPSMFDPCLGKLYRSTDNGLNWTMLADSNVLDVAISTSGKIFKIKKDSVNQYGGLLPNLYYSLDNGNNWIWSDIEWQLIDSLLLLDFEGPEKITISPEGFIYCNIVDEFSDEEGKKSSAHCKITEALGMPDWRDNIARSTDDGVTWSTPGKSVIGGEQFYFKDNLVLTVGHVIISGVPFPPLSPIFISPDYGNSWNHICTGLGLIGNHVLTSFSNNNIFTDAYNILYLSTDTCNTWTPIATLNIQAGLCWSSGSSEGMLIGTEDLGVFVFSDEGDSLGSRNEGLTNLNIHSFTLGDDGYVYAGTENGVWRRPLTEIVTSADVEPTQPTEFILEQNFPNPFNPSTVIRYQLPVSGDVTLKVYDILGNEVATLVNEYKPASSYNAEFTINNLQLSSGVYFYQLRAGDYVAVKKMILLK